MLAKPNAAILYATLAKGPKLPFDYQLNSTRHFMRELNRLGVTGAIDAGGGFQNYPDDYAVVQQLAADRLGEPVNRVLGAAVGGLQRDRPVAEVAVGPDQVEAWASGADAVGQLAQVVEQGPPSEVISNPQHERTKTVLSQVL